MKNIGLIMLLLLSLLGCKSKKSHVVKSVLDSSYVSREIKDIELVAVSTRDINSLAKLDSSWKDVIRLKGFSGTISPSGEIKGVAEEAQVDRSGNKSKQENQNTNERDSLGMHDGNDSFIGTRTIKEDLEKDGSSKGLSIPWYLWIAIPGLAIFLVYSKFKKYLKPF